MSYSTILINQSIRRLTRVLCRIDDSQLRSVPQSGPLIIVTNHINFLEVPLVYTHLLPRPLTGFVKAETWDNAAMAFLFNLWNAIPLRRGEADVIAFQQGLEALRAGKILAIAPEGTRSGDGRLRKGLPGVVMMARHSQAPILPVAYYGGENFWENLTHLHRTEFKIAVGRLFYIKASNRRWTHAERQKITDEIMYQVSELLPPEYRGYYSDLSQSSTDYIDFMPVSVDHSVAL